MEALLKEVPVLRGVPAGCSTASQGRDCQHAAGACSGPQPKLRVRTGSRRGPGVCCSTVRKDGSAESRGLRGVDKSQPTLREQFEAQKQQGIPGDAVSQGQDATLQLQAAAAAAARSRDGNGGSSPIKTTGLRRSPLSGGVNNASSQYDLPSPAVAVRNLVEQAQFAHLCTTMSSMHHRRAGYPFGTLVDFASDGAGFPIFCMSPLAIHTRNIVEDCRCSLVVQMPGWTGLANARVTIFGDVYQLPAELQEPAREIFAQKHSRDSKERWLSGSALFFRMHRISDVYFVGGFGTVQWVNVAEYTAVTPDNIVMHQPHRILQVLNDQYSVELRHLIRQGERSASDAEFISIDRLGADVRARFGTDYSVERVGFDQPVHTLEEAVASVGRLCAKFSDTDKAAGPGAGAKPTAADSATADAKPTAADAAAADRPEQSHTQAPK